MTRSSVGAALLALGLTLAVGCGKKEAEHKAPAASPSAQAPAQPAPPPAASPTPSGELPANFPPDVPRNPKARIEKASTMPDMVSVDLFVADDMDHVASFYSDGFAAQGWSTDTKQESGTTVVFADKDNRTAAAVLEKGDGGTKVSLVITEFPH